MREGTLDIEALIKANTRLNEAVIRFKKDETDNIVRDSVIQRFEFTYLIALKTIRKYFIERAFVTENINQMSFNDMIRTANQMNILKSDLTIWTNYREMRNLTSHTYDEEIAQQVVSVIPDFYKEIEYLINTIQDNGK